MKFQFTLHDNETNTQKVWVQDEPGAPWREFDPAGELISLRAEVERLKRANATLLCALEDAAKSLHTLSSQAGHTEELEGMSQVRGYAFSRYSAAIDAARNGGGAT